MMRRLPTTSFVGRNDELTALAGLFAAGERLITIVGPGGIGKTRLARHLLSLGPTDRSSFCDLVDVGSVPDAYGAVCSTLAIDVTRDRAEQRACEALAQRGNLTLVLDGVEPLGAHAASMILRLLDATPDLRILVTSRAALRIAEEAVYELGPLRVPSNQTDVATSEAGELWASRVKRVRAGYSIADDDPESLADLLRWLDGNPLAIELAASRRKVLTPAAILDHLVERLSVLYAPNVSDHRHRTLSAVVEASWEAASPVEQAVLTQLAVFAGSFSLEAASAVVESGSKVADVVQSLRDQSLVHAAREVHADRFSVSPAIRNFARQRSSDAAGRDRHAKYFASRAIAALTTPLESREAFVRARDELAMDRSNYAAVAATDGPSAVVCAYLLQRSDLDQSTRHDAVDAAIRSARRCATDAEDPLARALAEAMLATSDEAQGDVDSASARWSRALALADGQPVIADELLLGQVAAQLDRSDAIDATALESQLETAIDARHVPVRTRARFLMGKLGVARGRFVDARAWIEQAVPFFEWLSRREQGVGHLMLTQIYGELGAVDLARHALARARELSERSGDPNLAVELRLIDAWLSLAAGDVHGAIAKYEASDALLGGRPRAAVAAANGWYGVALLLDRRHSEAAQAIERGLPHVPTHLRPMFDTARSVARAAIDPSARLDLPSGLDGGWPGLLAVLVELERNPGRPAYERALALVEATRERVGAFDALLRNELARACGRLAATPRTLVILEGGDAYATPEQGTVRLRGQPLLRAVLDALVTAHPRQETTGIVELFAIAWPGEKASAQSIDDRVRAVIKRLRRGGLEGYIEAHRGGFRLRPDTIVERR